MNFLRKPLLAAVTMLSKVVANRPTMPLFSHIALRQDGDRLHMWATDLDLWLALDVIPTTADPERLGEPLAVPGRDFLAVLKNLTDEIVSLKNLPDADNNPRLSVNGITMFALDIKEFPQEPVPGDKVISIPFLAAAIARVVEARSHDESRFGLCSVHLSAKGSVESTDGHRLYRASVAPTKGFEEILVPGTFADLLVGPAFRKVVNPDTLHFGKNQEIFVAINDLHFSGWFSTRPLEGTFPNCEQIMPRDESATTTLTIKKADLLAGLAKVLAVVSKERQRPVELILENGAVKILGQNPDIGKAEVALTGTITGENLIIGMNGLYLKHAVESCLKDPITFRFNGWDKPLWLHDGEAPKKKLPATWTPTQLHILIMPMRTRDQNRKAA